MKVSDSIRRCIDDFSEGEVESSLLHACNAVDGTAKKRYAQEPGKQRARFTDLIRDYLWVIEPAVMNGIDLAASEFEILTEGKIKRFDFADVVYKIHRCAHGHGDELPEGFDLLPTEPHGLLLHWHEGRLRIRESLIFGLAFAAVLAPENANQRIGGSVPYLLGLDGEMFDIDELWGEDERFRPIADRHRSPVQLKMVF